MISLRPFYSEDLLEAEQDLAMQEYWDDLGSWWANSKVEKKIIMLGRFTMHRSDSMKNGLMRRRRFCFGMMRNCRKSAKSFRRLT